MQFEASQTMTQLMQTVTILGAERAKFSARQTMAQPRQTVTILGAKCAEFSAGRPLLIPSIPTETNRCLASYVTGKIPCKRWKCLRWKWPDTVRTSERANRSQAHGDVLGHSQQVRGKDNPVPRPGETLCKHTSRRVFDTMCAGP